MSFNPIHCAFLKLTGSLFVAKLTATVAGSVKGQDSCLASDLRGDGEGWQVKCCGYFANKGEWHTPPPPMITFTIVFRNIFLYSLTATGTV